MPGEANRPSVDTRQVRRNFARAAAGYDSVAVLQREIGTRMLERLDYVRIEPTTIVDLGCGTGGSLAALGERYRRASLLGVDASEAMLRVGRRQGARLRWLLPFLNGPKSSSLLVADARGLPLKTGCAGLVWSNLMLHWLDDPLAALRETYRVLTVGGLFMFSTFGPDTLKELRASFSDGYEHAQRFVDMHDYGDMLVECGFSDPVMDAERLTMTYPSVDALFRELRQNGAACTLAERRRGLMGKAAWQAALDAYEQYRHDGLLPASFEIVYGHAWKPEPRTVANGRTIIRFDPGRRQLS